MGAREDAVIERHEGDVFLGQLPLDVFVAVDAQFGVVREIGAEFQKEGTKVFIHAVEVVLVYRCRALHNPGVFLAVGVGALLGTKDGDFFLGLAEEHNPFACLKASTVFGSNIVLALPLLKGNDRNLLLLDEGIDLTQEGVGHHAHERRGSDGLAALEAEKASSLFFRLQFRLVDVEVHAIDALDFQGYVLAKDVGNAARYTHGWLRSTPILRDHCRLERPNNWGCASRPRTIDRSLFYRQKPEHA